jgi:predicted lysophospholipase L1 biosynthesis ABC-type transport system permease subunit
MPNPRDYMDGDSQYVRGYVRRRRKRRMSLVVLFCVVMLIAFIAYIMASVWQWVVAIGGVILLVYVLRHRKDWQHWFLMRRMRKLEEARQRQVEAEIARRRIAELRNRRHY